MLFLSQRMFSQHLQCSQFLSPGPLSWDTALTALFFSPLAVFPVMRRLIPIWIPVFFFLGNDNILIWLQSNLNLSQESGCFYGDCPYVSPWLLCLDYLGQMLRLQRAQHKGCQKILYLAHVFFHFCSFPSLTIIISSQAGSSFTSGPLSYPVQFVDKIAGIPPNAVTLCGRIIC